MKLIFMGTPEFAVNILKSLASKHDILMVVTQPDRIYGRKKEVVSSPVKKLAESLGILVFQPEKLMSDYQPILSLKPDYIITAAYGQMLPSALLNQITAINVHGSLLPQYRGGAPIQYAIFDGLKKTGITIMYMAYKMDSGDIIKQQQLIIEPSDNYQSLSQKLSFLGASLLDEVLEDLSNNIIHRVPQDVTKVSFAYTLKREDEYISFNQTSDQVINKIRGLSPEPGGYANIHNTTLKFYHAKKSDIIDKKSLEGTILDCEKRLIIKTQDGTVEILEVQALGKRKMAAKEFLNGQTILKKYDRFKERNSHDT